MNSIKILLAFLFCQVGMQAQITVTNTTFPKVGDTLKVLTTSNVPASFSVGPNNGPQAWDFNFLTAGNKQTVIYRSPSEGVDAASFSDANLLVISGGQEEYFYSSATKVEGLGFGGSNPILPINLAFRYSKKPTERQAPLTFINSTASVGEFKIDVSSNILPDSLVANLPVKPDSLRLQFNSNSKGIVDAYGTLKIQNKTFDVIREKAEIISDTKLFAKVPFLNWVDLSLFFPNGIPGGFSDFLGQDTTIVYNFYSNTAKEIILSAEYNTANELQNVTFINLGINTATTDIALENIGINPNPATNFIQINTDEWENGKYFLTISDMTGKVVYLENTVLQKGNLKEINTSNLPSGAYILTIRNQFNTKSGSTKLILE